MSRARIYLEPDKIKNLVSLKANAVIHKIKNVLRIKEGESIFVFDGEGREYQYEIINLNKKKIVIEKVRLTKKEDIPQVKVSVAFPLMKETKLDFLFQKATELGAFKFIPFFSQRTVITQRPSLIKLTRWKRIVVEAARQSERVWLPEFGDVVSFDALVRENYSLKMVAHYQGKKLSEILDKTNFKFNELLLVIGPEGGFAPEEIRELEKHKFNFVKLSPYILRSETAGIFFVGLVNYFIDTGHN